MSITKYFNEAFKDKKDKELIKEAMSLNNIISLGSYASHDVVELDAIEQELDLRGYEKTEQVTYIKK